MLLLPLPAGSYLPGHLRPILQPQQNTQNRISTHSSGWALGFCCSHACGWLRKYSRSALNKMWRTGVKHFTSNLSLTNQRIKNVSWTSTLRINMNIQRVNSHVKVPLLRRLPVIVAVEANWWNYHPEQQVTNFKKWYKVPKLNSC